MITLGTFQFCRIGETWQVVVLEVAKMFESLATLVADVAPVSAMCLNMLVPQAEVIILLATVFALKILLY